MVVVVRAAAVTTRATRAVDCERYLHEESTILRVLRQGFRTEGDDHSARTPSRRGRRGSHRARQDDAVGRPGNRLAAVRVGSVLVLGGEDVSGKPKRGEGRPVASRDDAARIAEKVERLVAKIKAEFGLVSEAGVEFAVYEAAWRIVERRGGKP